MTYYIAKLTLWDFIGEVEGEWGKVEMSIVLCFLVLPSPLFIIYVCMHFFNFGCFTVLEVIMPAVQNTYIRCRSRKCIECYSNTHKFLLLSFLQALYWSSFTSKTPNKDHMVEQLFFCLFFSSPITRRHP